MLRRADVLRALPAPERPRGARVLPFRASRGEGCGDRHGLGVALGPRGRRAIDPKNTFASTQRVIARTPFSQDVQRFRDTRARLDDVCGRLVQQTFAICDAALARANRRTRDIDAVYLSGGGTLMPMVADAVAAYFGRAPCTQVNPMAAVAIGASHGPDP